MPQSLGASSTVWLIRRALRRYAQTVREGLDEGGHADLPQRGFWVVHALASTEHSAADLVELLQITKQAVSQLVDQLVGLGYLERHPDPDDRRRVLLRLTRRGLHAARVIERSLTSVEHETMRRVGAPELDRLRGLLASLDTPDAP